MTPFIYQLLKALNAHTRETGLRLTPAFFELHVHPNDLADHFLDSNLQQVPLLHIREIAGIALVGDHRVPVSHPELVCTWRQTL